ncbi:MAG: ATP-dependent helicase, partial [Nonomuraea sp.]|nr:ATP-dependent helicase [Nonomuraea sp.]
LPFETMETSATFDRVLFDGGEFGTGAEVGSAEEEDFIGLPGLLEPDQVATLLRKRQSDQQAAKRKQTVEPPKETLAPHEQIAELRRELNGLVGAWNHRTGQPHGVIHAELRRTCGGPPIAQATAEQIQERIDAIRRWATQRR